MCRLVAYQGPPLAVSTVLSKTPHGLVHQSYAPREMTSGLLNADGWGLGWYYGWDEWNPPSVLKGTLPIWSDENATEATHAIESGSFVAAIRAASPGLGVAMANTPPYVSGCHLFAHNGRIWPWPEVLEDLRPRVAPEDRRSVRGTTDSEWLLALWRSNLRRLYGGDEAEALRFTLREVADLAGRHGGGISANLIVADGSGFLAVRFAEPGPAPSLYISRHESLWRGGVMVASEPLDDSPGWRAVPESTLLRAQRGRAVAEPLWPTEGGA